MTHPATTNDPETVWVPPPVLKEVGDHLEDLRWTFIKSIIAILLAFFFCFLFHKPLLQMIEAPFETTRIPETFKIIEQTETAITIERMGPTLMILGPLEGISIAIKASLWGALALAAPFWGYFLFQFALPGMHSHEKNMIFPFVIFSFLAMGLGALFGYSIVLPISNTFLMQFNQSLGVNFWSLEQALDYSLVLILANAIAFELMVILFLLTHFGWISAEQLKRKRKTAILTSLIIGAILTPPDVLTQILLAAPLIAGYELAIFYSQKLSRNTDKN